MTLYFDSTVGKKTKDGVFVLSSTLEPGEKLASGETYDEVAKRLGAGAPVTNVAAEAAEESPATSDALTLDPTGTSTIREGDTAPEEVPEPEPNPNVATLNAEGDSTEVQVSTEKLLADPDAGTGTAENAAEDESDDEDNSDDETEEDEEPKAPAFSADKRTLYDFAKEHKGLTEEYEDITKGRIIEKYFENKD